ncbi:MAG: cytochrome c3 family protein, partial [Candidatus Neomarinimicrobiota bacterium]
ASPHARDGLDCQVCHSVHQPAPGGLAHAQLLVKGVTETCRECHADQLAKFQLNERHRLLEGILDCATCHDPHEPPPAWLGGFKQEACLSCHTDKQGPFAFEHGGILVEGCAVCHDPHGSPNRHMLTFQRVEDQCISCHAVLPMFHLRFREQDPNCTNCHASIHGSNLSPYFLR